LTEQGAELQARLETLDVAQKRLQEIASERKLPAEVTAILSTYHDNIRDQFPKSNGDGGGGGRGGEFSALSNELRIELIGAERRHLHAMLREGRITDESRRRIERELDLEEVALISRGGVAKERPRPER
jgi:CPA1 family monovalent cation:H+ antiporter